MSGSIRESSESQPLSGLVLFVGPAGPPGQPGERGEQGSPGKLPVAKAWLPDSVVYEGEVVTLAGATWQTIRDTGTMPAPGARDWICLAAAARTPRPRGTFDAKATYDMLDIVTRDRATFIARCDNPGPCPGDGWQIIATQGHRGEKGASGERGPQGERGQKGESGVSAPAIIEWKLDRAAYEATPILSDGSAGPRLRLHEMFQQFLDDVSPRLTRKWRTDGDDGGIGRILAHHSRAA
jgi:hypothetical protein